MRKKWTALWFAVMIVALLLPAAAQAAPAQSAIKVKSVAFELVFDGKTIQLPAGQYLFVYKGTSYVPVRFISYALQKSVKWDGATKRVTVAEPTANERTVLQEYLMNAAGTKGQASSKGDVALTASPIGTSFLFDGTARTLPAGQTAYILNNSVYVPVRFMSESIGTEIKWDAAVHRIAGESQAYRDSQQPIGGNGSQTGNGGSGTGTGSTPGGSVPGGGGVAPVKPTEQQIKSETEQQLQSLYASAQSTFMSLLQQYSSATDEATKKSIYSQGESYLAQITAQFNQLMTQTEAKLTANGYGTSMIAEFRTRFDSEIAAARQSVEYLLGK